MEIAALHFLSKSMSAVTKLQVFLLPGYKILAYPGNAISFIAEIALTVWLLIMAVKEQK